ncbi:MAG: glucose-6-phosphate isomerase [Simkaniaceae bacterium]|nr:glucose-6-phosphate isomerase [Simkaniaceae bacterium]
MSSFSRFESVKQLRQEAEHAIDLSKPGVLSPKRMEKMVAVAGNLRLFYGTQRVTEKVLSALCDLSREAHVVEKMRRMQTGEIINEIEGYESERRAVLHTAMRGFFDQSENAQGARGIAEEAYAECEKLKALLDEIEKQEFTHMIQIGIGGSELGPKAIYLGLKAFGQKKRIVRFVSNIDPDDPSGVLSALDLRKTLIVIVSKSGSTLETRTNEQFVRNKLRDMGLSPEKHLIAITSNGSPMDDPARYKRVFHIGDCVGGRYSATSAVGCVALAFTIGMEKTLEFLRGAHEMDGIALEDDPYRNIPLLAALLGIWNHNFLGYATTAVIPYSQALSRFPAHIQQCDMESNGKRIDKQGRPVDHRTGPVIWGEIGTNGQHSFYQLIHQGTEIVPVEFIGFRHSQLGIDYEYEGTTSQEKLLSNLFAQSIGLATGESNTNPNKSFPGNRPSSILFADRCDPYTLGAILAFYEHKVAFQGFIWNINSFDQEGVQLGKILANKMIDLFAQKKQGLKSDSSFPLGTFFLNQLDRF